MRVYLKYVVSTQDGSCVARAWRAVIACRGLGAVVEAASMTIHREVEHCNRYQMSIIRLTGSRVIPSFVSGRNRVSLSTPSHFLPPRCSPTISFFPLWSFYLADPFGTSRVDSSGHPVDQSRCSSFLIFSTCLFYIMKVRKT